MSPTMAILTDTTLCTGCEDCVAACKEANGLGADVPRRWKRRIDDLSSTRYTTLVSEPGDRFVRELCRHCLEPACVSACLVGALQKTQRGPVIYDSDKCMGCRYCMNACPYGIPRYDWEKAVPFVRKCTMCHERLADGKQPACTEACTRGATVFGERDELLRIAHERIHAHPETYVNRVVGETEVGGTSVMYLSDIPLEMLAFSPELDARPLPELTWAALSKVPSLVVGMGTLMASLWWITGRRNRIAEECARRTAEDRAVGDDDDSGEAKGATR